MKKMFPLLLGLCVASAVHAAEIRCENAVIVSAKNQNFAAGELQKHLELISGEKIAVVDQAPAGKFAFYVGQAPEGAPKHFKPEEARVRVTPQAVYFYGDANNGVSHAVYMFLEDALGVRWIQNDDIAFTRRNPVRVADGESVWAPELRIRGIRGDKKYMVPWRFRLRSGAHDAPKYGHAFTQYWNRFNQSRPEYFALVNGKRSLILPQGQSTGNMAAYTGPATHAVAMCVGNPELVKQIIADWDKKSRYINICENDAMDNNSCHCAQCTGLDALKPGEDWTHNLADRYIHFANRVITEARRHNPDVRVTMYAYNASEQPPRREKVDKDVILGIVPTDFSLPAIQKYIQGWKKAGMNEFFYRPNRHHYYGFLMIPSGFEKHFFDVWQTMKRAGAIGFDYDSPGAMYPHQAFSDYVLFKAMSDPSKPFEYWEKHYCQAYGAAADDIRDYYRYYRTQIWDKRIAPQLGNITAAGRFYNFSRGLVGNIKNYYKDADFDATDALLKKALSKKLSPEERKRVEQLVVDNTNARLTFRAIADKTDAAAAKLLDYRKKHKIDHLPWGEQYWGDVCGIKRIMNFAEYTPPYVQTELFWNFKLDPQNVGLKEKWYADQRGFFKWPERMPTNGPWERPHKHYKYPSDAMRKLTADYDGVAWYASVVNVPKDWRDRKVFLYFGAVDESCEVFVNGKKAGEHIFLKPNDWNTPFAIEITPYINWNHPTVAQFVYVRVVDKAGAGGIWKRVFIVSQAK